MSKTVHVSELEEAGVPREFWRIKMEHLDCPDVARAILNTTKSGVCIRCIDRDIDCTAALSVAAKVLVARERTVRMRTEFAVMDAYTATFRAEMDLWNDLIAADVVLLDGLDGMNIRRNMQTAPFHLVEERFRKGRLTVLTTVLSDTDLAELYGEHLVTKYITRYFERYEI